VLLVFVAEKLPTGIPTQSFHFAPRFVGETFKESLYRAEYFLAVKMGINSNSKVLDVGCGVGGPMRNIARFTGSDITGVTLNDYQVKVGNQYCAQKGLKDQCRLLQGDFQEIGDKFPAESFDAAYEIEATCHSPNRREVFRGIHKCLKKGGIFVGYEWVVCPAYDGANPEHVRVKEGIEVGNGLPTLVPGEEIKACLRDAGFEVIEAFDANKDVRSEQQIPWYYTLQGSMSLEGFRMTRFGRTCTHCLINTLEFIKIAPPGSVRVSSLLNATALDLVEGGEKELFTPSYFFMARKV
jgi:sterol 24-C-methyltransferase